MVNGERTSQERVRAPQLRSAEALERIEAKLDEALDSSGWPETVKVLGAGTLFLGFAAFVLWLVFG